MDPWWVISSAAAALHGVEAGPVRDVDLLMSASDARRLLERLGVPPATGRESPLFQSDIFGMWRDPPLPVEIMGGFRLASAAGWEAVAPLSRDAIELDGLMLYVPCRAELARLLRRFGRPKDLARAGALEALNGAARRRG